MTRPTVYTCITGGYDELAEVDPKWDCEFVVFHDGSIDLPHGWTGRLLVQPGLTGIDLNRFAKMLPHRLGLASDRSLYVDGNIVFKADPRAEIDRILNEVAFAAPAHPERDCIYAEMRHALRIGFMPVRPAWRMRRRFRGWGVPDHAGLFEANLLYRRHNDPGVISLGEAWWSLWKEGLRRDQPLLIGASWHTGLPIARIEANDVHDPANPAMGIRRHRKPRNLRTRVMRRLLAELWLFRAWLPR